MQQLTEEEIEDLNIASDRLRNAVLQLCDDELVRSSNGDKPEPRPDIVVRLVDETRQALQVILLIAGQQPDLLISLNLQYGQQNSKLMDAKQLREYVQELKDARETEE